MSNEPNTQELSPKGLNKKLLLGIACVIALVIIVILAILLPKNATAKKVSKQLFLGEKYLSELNYEQAIAAYELVIKIDPKNEDAYIGLAEVYIQMGNFDKAEEVLKEAEKQVGATEAILQKQKEVKEKKEAKENQDKQPQVTPEPTKEPEPTKVADSTPTPVSTAVPEKVEIALNTEDFHLLPKENTTQAVQDAGIPDDFAVTEDEQVLLGSFGISRELTVEEKESFRYSATMFNETGEEVPVRVFADEEGKICLAFAKELPEGNYTNHIYLSVGEQNYNGTIVIHVEPAVAVTPEPTATPIPTPTPMPDIKTSVKKTEIKAKNVYNTEGYGGIITEELLYGEFLVDQYGLVDRKGTLIFDYGKFPQAINLNNGIFVAAGREINFIIDAWDDYSLYNLSGKKVIEETYDHMRFFNGYALVDEFDYESNRIYDSEGNDYCYVAERKFIDTAGKTVLTIPSALNVLSFWNESTGNYYYSSDFGDYGEGLLWTSICSEFKEQLQKIGNIAEIKMLDLEKYGELDEDIERLLYCIDMEGNIVIDGQKIGKAGVDIVYEFSDGLARVRLKDSGLWGYIDKKGKIVISAKYEEASNFRNGYAYVKTANGKWGYIDKKGNTVIPMEYDAVHSYSSGMFLVGKYINGELKYGIVDKNNKTIVPLEYDVTFGYSSGLFVVGKNMDGQMKYGAVDASNKIIVPLAYDDLSTFEKRVGYGIKDGYLHVITLE